jgi:hypothetical protein
MNNNHSQLWKYSFTRIWKWVLRQFGSCLAPSFGPISNSPVVFLVYIYLFSQKTKDYATKEYNQWYINYGNVLKRSFPWWPSWKKKWATGQSLEFETATAKHLIKWKEEINLIIKLKYVHNDFALYVSYKNMIIKKNHPEVEMPGQFQSIFIVIHFLKLISSFHFIKCLADFDGRNFAGDRFSLNSI